MVQLIAYVHKSSDFYNWYKKYDGEYKKSLYTSLYSKPQIHPQIVIMYTLNTLKLP